MYYMPEMINQLVNRRDANHLAVCTIEEMSELTKVLTKYIRDDAKFSSESLAEELAHVFLMATALQIKFDVPDYDIGRHVDDALLRFIQSDGGTILYADGVPYFVAYFKENEEKSK